MSQAHATAQVRGSPRSRGLDSQYWLSAEDMPWDSTDTKSLNRQTHSSDGCEHSGHAKQAAVTGGKSGGWSVLLPGPAAFSWCKFFSPIPVIFVFPST